MQFAKDSFFLALRERLAGLNPARTVTVDGATVPAVLVVENLAPTSGEPLANTFYISWGAAEVVNGRGGSAALMSLEAVISYYTFGSVNSMVDRGRMLGQLDSELLGICQPPYTEKRDYTKSPSIDLGTSVFWRQPSWTEQQATGTTQAGERQQDARVERKARLTIYFFPEGIWS